MEKSLKSKKLLAFTKGLAGFTGILLVLLIAFSCSNLIINDGGSLVIAVPGARAAIASSFTIKLTGANGTTKSKTLTSGTTAQFDDLAPDTYTIVVEGMDASGSVVFYGTSSATVTAGKKESAIVNLLTVINSFEELQSAVATDCSLYIGSSFEVRETIVIGKNVNIMAMTNASLSSSVIIFQIDEEGKLTLAGELESKTLTLQTSGTSVSNIKINGGELVLEDGVSIIGENFDGCVFYGYSSDSKGGTFYMNGGSITNKGASNSKGGIYISSIGTAIMSGGTISGQGNGVYFDRNSNFTMTGGTITGNSSGASISNDSTFTISGDAVVNSINLPNSAAITVGGVLTGSIPVATITMASYTSRTDPVLKDAEGMNFVSTEYQKFAVGNTGYTIDSSGKLQQVQ